MLCPRFGRPYDYHNSGEFTNPGLYPGPLRPALKLHAVFEVVPGTSNSRCGSAVRL